MYLKRASKLAILYKVVGKSCYCKNFLTGSPGAYSIRLAKGEAETHLCCQEVVSQPFNFLTEDIQLSRKYCHCKTFLAGSPEAARLHATSPHSLPEVFVKNHETFQFPRKKQLENWQKRLRYQKQISPTLTEEKLEVLTQPFKKYAKHKNATKVSWRWKVSVPMLLPQTIR